MFAHSVLIYMDREKCVCVSAATMPLLTHVYTKAKEWVYLCSETAVVVWTIVQVACVELPAAHYLVPGTGNAS